MKYEKPELVDLDRSTLVEGDDPGDCAPFGFGPVTGFCNLGGSAGGVCGSTGADAAE